MASYKEIHGIKVQYRDSDATAVEGDVWYNSGTGKLRMYASLGSWASTPAVNDARYALASAGTTTAAVIAGGYGGSPAGPTAKTEEYNGSSWTEVNDLGTAKTQACMGVMGTQTAALSVGGAPPPGALVQIYDGTTWTNAPANMNTAKYSGANFGTTTAALAAGGEVSGTIEEAETFDGSSWTEVSDLNQERAYLGGFGTTTAGIAVGGFNPPNATQLGNTETWNGTSWTEGNDLNTVRVKINAVGITTAGLVFAGDVGTPPEISAITESYDGTSWAEVGDLSTATGSSSASGTATSALSATGDSGETGTEEWSFSASVETVAFD